MNPYLLEQAKDISLSEQLRTAEYHYSQGCVINEQSLLPFAQYLDGAAEGLITSSVIDYQFICKTVRLYIAEHYDDAYENLQELSERSATVAFFLLEIAEWRRLAATPQEMPASLIRPTADLPPPARHYNIGPNDSPQPKCGARSCDHSSYARTGYTRDVAQVTCRRCIKSLAAERRR